MSNRQNKGGNNLTFNRKATHEYFVLERYEAGIELVGTEVKVVRNKEASLSGSYAQVRGGEIFIHQLHIPPYAFGNQFNHDALRVRRLLMHKREIFKLRALTEQKGLTLIPLRLYLSQRGKVKVEIGVCRGKAHRDKREAVKQREADLEARRSIARYTGRY